MRGDGILMNTDHWWSNKPNNGKLYIIEECGDKNGYSE
jgi:hypothetical protein